MLARSIHVRKHGFQSYPGDARQICRQIVDACWNGEFFQTSAGHFAEFWTRDFGWCIDSLLELGHRQKVLKTLDYALAQFSKAGKITTTINPNHQPFDFPRFAPDSLPFLMRALNAAKAKSLMEKHRKFLQSQADDYAVRVIDPKTKLVRKEKFSSMKDGVYRKSSAYDTAMVGMLANEMVTAKIAHSLPDMRKALIKHYWTGDYFLDDLSGKKHIAGDAQLFPFWTGVITDKSIMRKAFGSVRKAGLDKPFPLKYTAERMPADVLAQRIFAPNYEGNTIWAHMGLLYIAKLKEIDKDYARVCVSWHRDLVERYGTFLEVYEPDGRSPYRSPFYVADEGMLWAANLLTQL
jgi:hypothetical protein